MADSDVRAPNMRNMPGQLSIDTAFAVAGHGDTQAFAVWMSMVETPLRQSLARFARVVDSEVVVQETFLRMWLVARDPARRLEGEDALLRFALRVARNVVHEELRRMRPYQSIDDKELNELPEMSFAPELPDPALGKAISECIDRLPEQPKTALRARIQEGYMPDRDLAQRVRMKLNTFLQNIVRARKLMSECLERRGVRLVEILS
jgi:DNA-directed RNA polymerase specialized sigma24 family protein